MLIEHRGRRPTVHPSAYVAPTAVLCGDVHVGPDTRILFGAVLTAEDGRLDIGANCVVMENALVRGRATHHTRIEDNVLVGPHAHVNGATVEDGSFLATGCAIFPGAVVGTGAEVQINGVVHVNTRLAPAAVLPIGWIAVGDPAQLFPPGAHEEIWQIQEQLDFPSTVYQVTRDTPTEELMRRQTAWFGAHLADRTLGDD